MNDSQLTIPASKRLEVTPPSTASLIGAVIESGITSANVDVIERLCALKEREDARQAERDFAIAFAAIQAETPKIMAKKAVPGNNGEVRYKFAPYEEIMKAVRPLLSKYGFAVTYDQDIDDGRVTVTCTLLHVGGHSKSNKHKCRIGSGPPKASEAQADGAGTTYAKRFALCAALGITIESDDTDGRNEGDGETITAEQAADLRLRCENIGASAPKFLEWLIATDFESIKAKDYSRADAMLKRKAAAK